MENIRFNDVSQIIEFFRGSRKLGYGMEGTCYKIGKMSYKFYNSVYREIYSEFDCQEELIKYKDIMIDNIYFIRALIFYGNNLMGSVSEYASGKSCGNVWLYRRNLDKIIRALGILKNNIYKLSELGICVMDHDLSNMLYDDNVFSLIDVGDYCYADGVVCLDDKIIVDDVDTIYRDNMKKISGLLFRNVTGYYNFYDDFIFGYLQNVNSPYKDYLKDIDLMVNIDDTIIGIRNEIQECIGREIKTFSGCRKDLQRIMKMR